MFNNHFKTAGRDIVLHQPVDTKELNELIGRISELFFNTKYVR
jgi:hypothetical protein